MAPDRRPWLDLFFRSDNVVFALLGIPAHTLGSSEPVGDYHRPSDEVSRLDASHYAAAVRVAAAAARLLANGRAPVWEPDGQP